MPIYVFLRLFPLRLPRVWPIAIQPVLAVLLLFLLAAPFLFFPLFASVRHFLFLGR